MKKNILASRLQFLLNTTWAFFGVHMILRFCTLARENAFGLPFVSKLEWYIFHAWAIDFLLLLVLLSPFTLFSFKSISNLIWKLASTSFVFIQLIVLLMAVLDQELYRFLGGHLTRNIIVTYGNSSSIFEAISFLGSDESIPFLGISFGIILPYLAFFFYKKLAKKDISLVKSLALTLILAILFWTFKNVIWRGGNREKKLEPGIVVLYKSLFKESEIQLEKAEFLDLSKEFQKSWIQSQGDSTWNFPNSDYPYYKVPLFEFCKDNSENIKCKTDFDNDGYVGKEDCNPLDSTSHNNAKEIPSNGIDENCDGIDDKPWNVVFMILESHRGVFNGFLKPYGAFDDATPFLNKIVPQSTSWAHFNTSGIPTIAALMTTHTSILEHYNKFIASNFLTLNHQSFTGILKSKGYQSHFFSAADPTWDNQIPWLKQWYADYSYDRSRETDRKTYRHMAQWMSDSLKEPFVLTSMSKVNHYPFNGVDEMDSYKKEMSLSERMIKTMTYTEESLDEFFEFAKKQSWFDHTLFVFMADHGFSLGINPKEHGNGSVGSGLYSEYTWIPFVIYGQHFKLNPGAQHTYPASQVDIGPTLLDLLGIQVANHFIGHSLVRKNAAKLQRSYFIKGDEALFEDLNYRSHFSITKEVRPYGNEVFDANSDRNEQNNLYPTPLVNFDSLQNFVKGQSLLNSYLIETNKIFPE